MGKKKGKKDNKESAAASASQGSTQSAHQPGTSQEQLPSGRHGSLQESHQGREISPQQSQQSKGPPIPHVEQGAGEPVPESKKKGKGPKQHQMDQELGPQTQSQQGQRGPGPQQQRGPDSQQHPGHLGPGPQRLQEQRGPGPQEQQRGPGPHEQQRGPGPQQQQRGPGPQQQQRGPWPQQQQRGPGPQQQQRGPGPQQQQRGPGPQEQQQRGPGPQEQQRGPGPQQQQRGPGPQQQQRGPGPQQQPMQLPEQREPVPQQQRQRGPGPQQQVQRGPGPQQPTGGPSREPPTRQFGEMGISEQLEDRPLIKANPGTQGRRIKIEVNHLKLGLGKLKSAIHYDVNIIPDLPKRCLRTVMEKFREAYYPKCYPAFDGRKNLYSTKLLPFGQTFSGTVTIDLEERKKEYKVELQYANEVDLTPLHNLMNSVETPREALQVVDIVLRMAPASRCIPAGRSFFVKPQTIIDLGEGMEMYNGFYQSAIRGWQPFLNVDVAHKAFPKSLPVTEVLMDLLNSHWQPFGPRDLDRPLDSRQTETFQKYMRQLRVIYQIPGNASSKRVFRVNGIRESARNKTFKLDDGRSMTIEQYFSNEKRYRLKYPLLPTLWVGSTQREILIPLELCTVIEGQAVNRKMTENQTSAMIKFAATSTDVRKTKIKTAVREAAHSSNPSVREFGFSIANEFEQLEARVLQPPLLGYNQDRRVSVSRGVWRGERFFQGQQINKWTIAVADRRPPRPDDLSKMAEMIFRNAASCGMAINNPATKPFQTMGSNLNEIIKYFQVNQQNGYDIIFVVVPNQGFQYSYVKKAAELNVGCLTQCVKMRTLNRMNPQTVGNILLKVNSKLNGTNHILSTRPPIMNRPCMIMGADVTHPSPDSQGIPSVAAVTASHDPKAFRYNICWRLQPPRMEIIEDLENITREHLLFFHSQTNVKPERIVFFRDGVSEGQFDQVKAAEIMAIRRACKKLQASGYEPSITFLVVQKRHHTRMFPMNPRDSEDKNNNVPAGTCVDTVITHPFMQDFYLVSHASIQGVAKPTKYCTLWDDNKMTNDEIEQLTYFLCHMFSRCNRSVSYPAPTYYAHLAAARAKVYVENDKLNMNDLKRENERYKILDVIRKDLPMFFV